MRYPLAIVLALMLMSAVACQTNTASPPIERALSDVCLIGPPPASMVPDPEAEPTLESQWVYDYLAVYDASDCP